TTATAFSGTRGGRRTVGERRTGGACRCSPQASRSSATDSLGKTRPSTCRSRTDRGRAPEDPAPRPSRFQGKGGESLARVAAHETLVDHDPEAGPVRDLELAVHHGECFVDELVQQGVRAERILEDEPRTL